MTRLDQIITGAREGKSAREIAAEIGCTKNAVCGAAFRAGISLAALKGYGHREPKPPKPPRQSKPRKPKRERDPERVRRGLLAQKTARERGVKTGAGGGYSLEVKIAAMADHFAGLSLEKTAEKHSVSISSVGAYWRRNPAIVEPAKLRAAQIIAARQENLARALDAAKAIHAARLAQQRATNEPIIARLDWRTRLICERYLSGQSLQEIGDALGVTRERIRQLLQRPARLGLDFFGTLKGPFREIRGAPKQQKPEPEQSPERRRHADIMVWHHGPKRALEIVLGIDDASKKDLAKWRNLGLTGRPRVTS